MRVEFLGFILPNDIRAPCRSFNNSKKKKGKKKEGKGFCVVKRTKCIKSDYITSKVRLVSLCYPKPLEMASV